MATKWIQLDRPWSGHTAGETLEEQDYTVDSMVRKGYGHIVPAPKKAKAEQPPALQREIITPQPHGPEVETADAYGAAEAAVVSPQIGKRGGKGKPAGQDKGD